MSTYTNCYKKVSSFSKEELNERLHIILDRIFNSFIYKVSEQDYVDEMIDLDKFCIENPDKFNQKLVNEAKSSNEQDYHDFWKEHHELLLNTNVAAEKFISHPEASYKDFIEIIEKVDNRHSYLREHNGDYYIEKYGCQFRCYMDSNEFDTADELIDFLNECHPLDVEFYVVDETGKRERTINGVSDELKEYLQELYKDNDIYVYFF